MIWTHQANEIEKALVAARALPWSPRSGKTKAVVRSMRRASEQLNLRRFLVIGPTLALHTTWMEELTEEWPYARVLNLAGGSVQERIALLDRETASGGVLVVLVNWEALSKLNAALGALLPKIEGVVADEAHNVKRPGAQRSKALHYWHRAPWRRILTGTLTPKNYADVYSQWKFLNPSRFGTSQERFRERYCVMDPRFPGTIRGYVHLDELHANVAQDATVVDRRTVLGTPHELDVPILVPLVPSLLRQYNELTRKHTLNGINYPNRLTRQLAKRQFTSGFQVVDGEVHWLHDLKINAALEAAEEFYDSEEPLPIFYQWTAEGNRLHDVLSKKFGRGAVAQVMGETPVQRRIEILQGFRLGRLPFLVWQEQTDTQGISLAAADACMFYSHSFNFANVKQARDRIWKETGMLRYLYLRCPGTEDDVAWEIVKNKGGASERFLEGVMNAGI